MRRTLALALAVMAAGCAGRSETEPQAQPETTPAALDPRALVLSPGDLARGYEYGDDTTCGQVLGTEGEWKQLAPLFADERPHACSVELDWMWEAESPYSFVSSHAYVFRDEDGARRAFDARGELAEYEGPLTAREREPLEVGDEAELLRGRGLNDPASGVVWRSGRVVGILVVEPDKTGAAVELARKQQARFEHPPPLEAADGGNDPELQLDDPSLDLPVYWLGRTFDPPGRLPALELDLATVGANGPGQVIQLWYGVDGFSDTVNLDTWEPTTWNRFRQTGFGRLIWDSPCAHKEVMRVPGGRAEIYVGYSTLKRVARPCPAREPNHVVAHVYYDDAVLTVHLPYGYPSVTDPSRSPYDTVAATETIIRSLRLREARR